MCKLGVQTHFESSKERCARFSRCSASRSYCCRYYLLYAQTHLYSIYFRYRCEIWTCMKRLNSFVLILHNMEAKSYLLMLSECIHRIPADISKGSCDEETDEQVVVFSASTLRKTQYRIFESFTRYAFRSFISSTPSRLT